MDKDLIMPAIFIQLPLICFMNWLMIKEIYIICFKKDEIYHDLELILKSKKQKKFFITWTIIINFDLVIFALLIKYSIIAFFGAISFYFILSMIFVINTNILTYIHKNSKTEVKEVKEVQEDEINFILREEVNCILPNGRHTIVSLSIEDNEIVLIKKSFFLNAIVGVFTFEVSDKKSGNKKAITKINLSDVNAIERKRAGLNSNAFYVSVNHNSIYCFIFNDPRQVYIKLRKILPSVSFINFDKFYYN